ncbi:exocyst complex component exo70b1 [Phtheirospermum japonicum]|uniref:Exocyst subunit Exo70 family protein n=1 Tax=Phtheirospermum japonicum TaxID=374723 RepID=A0A830DCI2_9LAMI|nr:exocyst complex component exo70b1 [Phtheirospermum japonicum]
MDADKDKPLPEKSPTLVASTDDAKIDNNDNISSNENHPDKEKEKPDIVDVVVDQDSPNKKTEPHTPSPRASSPDAAADQPSPKPTDGDDNTVEPSENTELEKENQQPADNDDDGDQTSPKEEEPPDLEKLSEEIDHYILTLSTPTKTDHDTDAKDVPHFVQQFAVLVDAKIGDYDSPDNPVRWARLTEEDSKSFLEYVHRLSSLTDALSQFSSDKKYADAINRVGLVLQRAMSYVEEEFKSLLEHYTINDSSSSDDAKLPKQSPSPTSNQNQEPEQNPPPPESPAAPAVEEHNFFPGYSDEILSDLIRLSKALIAGGHETECCQVYFVARRNALEDSLHKLGFEKYSIDEVQKLQWESLEREIVSWIATFKQCFSAHFPSEKKVSDSVFLDHPSISESLHCSLSQGIIIQLLNFAGAVALTKRAAEKLFKFLDMYEVLRDTLPTIDNLFPEDLVNDIKTEGSRIKGRLGEAMISIFAELESSIGSDSAKTPVPGGAVHPLTRYTMNYLKLACEYKDTLEQVFREHQKIERADSATGSDFNYNNSQAQMPQVKQSPFQAQMAKAMDLLDANLEGKAKLYKDNALSSIFMMNNGRYILQKVRGSNEIISLMGDSWCRHRSSDLRNYHKVYQRETWGRLLHCLHPDGLTVHGKVVKPVLKERFKSFNAMFDEIHKAQSNWVVSDEQLQSELRVSISNMVIPAYRSFLGRFSQVFTPGRQTEKYVKYQAEEIETLIDELFDGNAAPAGRKKT